MRAIHLTQGKHTFVDDDVYEWASKFKWHARKGTRTFYAARTIRLPNGKRGLQLLHREILKAPPGVEVDHADGNGLNNPVENLRTCSHAENARNRPKRCDNASGYVGVWFYSRWGKYRASICVNGRRTILGLFDSALEAARARDKAAIEFHGDFVRLNFPRL